MPSQCSSYKSSFQTFMNIFKAIVGAGVSIWSKFSLLGSFALPFALNNMGIAGGLIIISIAGLFW
jgi:hypothetical protein